MSAPTEEQSNTRGNVTFRLGDGGKDWLDSLAAKHRCSRTDVIRHAFAVARRHEAELERRLEDFR